MSGPGLTDAEPYLAEGKAVLAYVRGFTGGRAPLPGPGLLAACIRNSLAARGVSVQADNDLRARIDSLSALTEGPDREGTARWSDCCRDSYSLAIEEARATLTASPAPTEDREADEGYLLHDDVPVPAAYIHMTGCDCRGVGSDVIERVRAVLDEVTDRIHAGGCNPRHQQGETDECNSCTAHAIETAILAALAPSTSEDPMSEYDRRARG